jgi:hypothetical protein
VGVGAVAVLGWVVGGGTWRADGDGNRGHDQNGGGGEDGTADAVDEGLLGSGHEPVPDLAELSEGGRLGEGDGVLGTLGQLIGQALDGVGHAVAVLLVEDAAEDGDAQGAAEFAGGVVDRRGDALLGPGGARR